MYSSNVVTLIRDSKRIGFVFVFSTLIHFIGIELLNLCNIVDFAVNREIYLCVEFDYAIIYFHCYLKPEILKILIVYGFRLSAFNAFGGKLVLSCAWFWYNCNCQRDERHCQLWVWLVSYGSLHAATPEAHLNLFMFFPVLLCWFSMQNCLHRLNLNPALASKQHTGQTLQIHLQASSQPSQHVVLCLSYSCIGTRFLNMLIETE